MMDLDKKEKKNTRNIIALLDENHKSLMFIIILKEKESFIFCQILVILLEKFINVSNLINFVCPFLCLIK